jgi:hypothetical protein
VTVWLVGCVVIAGATAAPMPESATTRGEFVALLTTVTLPGRLPVEVGANVTLKEVD